MAFVLAVVTATAAFCSMIYESMIAPAMWSGSYDNGIAMDYEASWEYHQSLMDTYEQLCILGMVELANSDSSMEYQGSKSLMSDFLYYMDYNKYPYKKTDVGVVPVSDMFDYYVSYTKPSGGEKPRDDLPTDEETTSGETDASADYYAGEITLFITNFPSDVINEDMSEQERIELLQGRYSDHILRSEDTISSDMISSGIMRSYEYRTSRNGQLSELIHETYSRNFLPLGSCYSDSCGRYVYNFGNDEPIVFYSTPYSPERGRQVSRDWLEIRIDDLPEAEQEYYHNVSSGFEEYYDEDLGVDEIYARVYIEDLPYYETYDEETAGLTVFIAPKDGLIAQYEKDYADLVGAYIAVRWVSIISRLIAALAIVYLLISAAALGLCGDREEAVGGRIPLEICIIIVIAMHFLVTWVLYNLYGDYGDYSLYITDQTKLAYGVYAIVSGIVAGVDIFVAMHTVRVIFGRQFKQRLLLPRLISKLIGKYHTSELYKITLKLSAGQKLRRRSLMAIGAFIVVIFYVLVMAMGTYPHVEAILIPMGGISVLVFFWTVVKDLILAADLDKLRSRIAALKHNETFTEKISESSGISSDIVMLDNISETVREAVEDQIKSERMKIELVANVSHDLKTPLTSIISYIDLLKKTDLGPEASDYVQILDKKAQKLKGIVADVFSLAKATSGIDVNMEELDFITLFNQSLADADDKIRNSGRILKVQMTEKTAPIMGDGSKLYRVFQNIIDNALKYSMEGSRIFMDVERRGDSIVFIAKNMSSYPIDFTPDEITERFVRGDSSRTDGGSGLGLSIAKSFTEACGGSFHIELDGDMFKAVTSMPLIKKEETTEEHTDRPS